MRRASSGLPHSSPIRASSRASLHAPIEEPQPITAASVANAYFEKELAAHQEEDVSVDTVVILHDDCYGHRFSRPKTPKGTLNTIVERPERLQASVLGLSAAYVRLGGLHSEGQRPPHPDREIDRRLPFLIRKTARAIDISSNYVTSVHGKAWMEELKVMCGLAGTNLASTGKELARIPNGTSQSSSPPKAALHEGDLYLSSESLNAFQGALGGVCEGIDVVFQNTMRGQGASKAFVCIRPPGHHCSSDLPSGFCWLNNVHVGIEYAAQNYGLTHAAILDFDLHHGDGSQSIAWARNSRVAKLPKNTTAAKRLAIGYYSLHDINSFPCEWGEDEKVQSASLCIENAHNQSMWNVHLEPWKTEADFWNLYEKKYSVIFEKARRFLQFHSDRLRNSSGNILPRAAIFLSAGFDASHWEGQGMQRHKVNVPTDFFARFTEDAVKLAQEPGLGVGGRVISVLEGGYSDKALISGVMSHLSGLASGRRLAAAGASAGLGLEISQRLGALSLDNQEKANGQPEDQAYNSSWWSFDNLTALEALIAPPSPAPAPKKRTTANNASHYTSPTQSFTAKVVDPTKIYRSTSGYSIHPQAIMEPATPPIPDVDWLTAVGELSKILVPQNRQTKSCRPEELLEPRVKKERQSINTLPSAEPAPSAGRMQLRERKSKAPSYADPKSDEDSISGKAPSKTNRRRTIADVSSLSEDKTPPALPQLPPQQLNGQVRAEVATKPNLESATNIAIAPKSTKVNNRTQQKPANTTGSGVNGKKKALEKPMPASRTKLKIGKTEPPSTSLSSAPKVTTPAAVSENYVLGGAVQSFQPPVATDPDVAEITSTMESKLNLGAGPSENSKDQAIKIESSDSIQPLSDEAQVRPEQNGMTPNPPDQFPPERGVVDRDHSISETHDPTAGGFALESTESSISKPIGASAAALPDTSTPVSYSPASQTQDLLPKSTGPASTDGISALSLPVPHQDDSNTITSLQTGPGAEPYIEQHRNAQPMDAFEGINLSEPVNNQAIRQALPIFSSQGHIPFGELHIDERADHIVNQQPAAVETLSGEQTGISKPDMQERSYSHGAYPGSTEFPVAPGMQGSLENQDSVGAYHSSTMQKQQFPAGNQPFTDLPPVPDFWDVPNTPDR